MKNIMIIILLMIPISLFAKKKHFANPCDDMDSIVILNEKPKQLIVENSLSSLMTFTSSNKKENFKIEKLNDSTLIGNGVFEIKKQSDTWNEVYGYYYIRGNSDGFISYNIIINVKDGKLRYEFNNLNHYGAKNTIGPLCTGVKDNVLTLGLKVQFLKRADEIVRLLINGNKNTSW